MERRWAFLPCCGLGEGNNHIKIHIHNNHLGLGCTIFWHGAFVSWHWIGLGTIRGPPLVVVNKNKSKKTHSIRPGSWCHRCKKWWGNSSQCFSTWRLTTFKHSVSRYFKLWYHYRLHTTTTTMKNPPPPGKFERQAWSPSSI